MSIYDDVAAEARADWLAERERPDYRDMIWEWADEPLFSHSDVPLHVYETAENTDQSQEDQ